MVYVVERSSSKVLNRCDAWANNAVEEMEVWAVANGYEILGDELVEMNSMIVWVR